jgi:fusarinine C synthase
MYAANDSSTVLEPTDVGKAVGSISWIVNANDHTRLAPIGVIGELVMEAHIMARGYYKQEDQSSTVFLEAPIWLRNGYGLTQGRTGRVYKTGNLVRYGPEGSIVYMGRKDKQIKIRGKSFWYIITPGKTSC